MKKILFKSFSVLMAIVLLVVQTHSATAKTVSVEIPSIDESVLSLNDDALNQAMEKLNQLDNYLDQNEGVTFNELKDSGSDLIANVSDSVSPMGMAQDDDSPLGIPAFLWGCVLGWVGLLIVYLVTDGDKTQTHKALIGCLVGTGVWVVFYVVYAVWIVSEATPYYY